jgi:uncharacterized protein YjbJ (UPF0337 family)
MDREPISRAAKKVRASITEALGKPTGGKATESKGTAQKKEAEAELPEIKTNLTAQKRNLRLRLIEFSIAGNGGSIVEPGL